MDDPGTDPRLFLVVNLGSVLGSRSKRGISLTSNVSKGLWITVTARWFQLEMCNALFPLYWCSREIEHLLSGTFTDHVWSLGVSGVGHPVIVGDPYNKQKKGLSKVENKYLQGYKKTCGSIVTIELGNQSVLGVHLNFCALLIPIKMHVAFGPCKLHHPNYQLMVYSHFSCWHMARIYPNYNQWPSNL